MIRQVEQFLYLEARLLDDRQLHEWLDLLTDDVRCWMPIRSNRYPVNSKAISILDGSRYEEGDLTKDSLQRRVARLDTGMAWAEDPPSRTRHFVTNVEVQPGDKEGELKVYSNFIMYRTRAETEEDFYVGSRQDVLRIVGGDFEIAYRRIVLDQNVLLAKNVSNFF